MFATIPVREGEVVAIVGGELLTEDEFQERAAALSRYNAIQVDDTLHLLGAPEELDQAAINHSCDSNLWMHDENTNVARRDIAAGEELTIDYALFTASEDWRLEECRCSTEHCRGTVTGGDWRLSDIQQRYASHFSPFLNRRIVGQGLPTEHKNQ